MLSYVVVVHTLVYCSTTGPKLGYARFTRFGIDFKCKTKDKKEGNQTDAHVGLIFLPKLVGVLSRM